MQRLPLYRANGLEVVLYGNLDATQCLVFYHGTNLSAQNIILGWQLGKLLEMHNDVCIVAFTRPGYSGLVAQPSDHSPEATAAAHGQFLAELNLEPLAVIGHSGGSLAAYHLACYLRANSHQGIRLVEIAPTASDDILERQRFQGQLKFRGYRDLFLKWPRLAQWILSPGVGWLNRVSPEFQYGVWADTDPWMHRDAEMKGALVSSIKHAAQGPHSGRGFALDFQSFMAGWGHLTYFPQSRCFSFSADPIVPPDMVRCLAAEMGGVHSRHQGGHFEAWNRDHPQVWGEILEFALGLED